MDSHSWLVHTRRRRWCRGTGCSSGDRTDGETLLVPATVGSHDLGVGRKGPRRDRSLVRSASVSGRGRVGLVDKGGRGTRISTGLQRVTGLPRKTGSGVRGTDQVSAVRGMFGGAMCGTTTRDLSDGRGRRGPLQVPLILCLQSLHFGFLHFSIGTRRCRIGYTEGVVTLVVR